jgi:hypothetical protein
MAKLRGFGREIPKLNASPLRLKRLPVKPWLRLVCLCCLFAALAPGCGEEAGAPTDRESIVIEEPAPESQNSPSNRPPKEGRLPDKFKR